jgi:ATP-binding cassette subfamily B protein
MSTSDGATAVHDDVVPPPPALKAMWRLVRLGYQHEPGLLVYAVIVTILNAIPDSLLALWLMLLADGVADGDDRQVMLSALGIAVSVTWTWVFNVFSGRIQRRFRDRVTIALETHVARLQATIGTVAHQERPEYLDRLSVLRQQVFVLDHMYLSVLNTLAWLVRLGITLVLLASVHPALVLLALAAVPTVVTASTRPAAERQVEERAAVHERLASHLFTTATTAAPGKEVRVTGIGADLVADRRTSWERWYHPVSRARWRTSAWNAGSWAVFGVGFGIALWFVAVRLDSSPGVVLLLLTAGARLSQYVAQTVSEIGFLRGIWLDGAVRLAWLEDYAAATAAPGERTAPDRIDDAITLRGVTFTYPGADRPSLVDVDLRLPAGSVVALVGENGAGKTTLVKLLAKMYDPEQGSIEIDGVPLRTIETASWRERLAGAFQDFHRFEFTALTSVGLGELDRADDRVAVAAAVDRAGATADVDRLPDGLDTQLGPTWPGGAEVSFGQWQKLALARGFMREEPLLLVLDEPTAALDAETEHALFERYAAAARIAPHGGITLLVSHRFSTVRMADLIVVLDGASVVEVGSHADLVAAGGAYAELFAIQQHGYRA